MSVSFIVGKPGGGKSMLATRVIITELISTDRYVITNVPLRVKRLIEYVAARYGAHINPSRIKILNDEETKTFFLHRPGGHIAPMPPDGTNGVVDYSQCVGPDGVRRDNGELVPAFYVIDEAHLHFGARDWAKTGKAAMWYLSQHRHFGDNVVFVTQSWKNVDSAFRRLAQEFTTCVNLSKRRAFGFRLPPVFMLRTFDQEPTPYATEVSTETQRLDVDGLASCYDTAAGVGITTGLADTRDKPTGLHWGFGIACVVVGLCLLGFLPVLMGKGAEVALNAQTPKLATNIVAAVTNALPVATNAVTVQGVTNRLGTAHVPAHLQALRPPLAAASGPVVEPLARLANGAGVIASNAQARLAVGPAIEPERLERVKFYIRRENGFVVLGLENGDVFTVGDGRLHVVGKLAVVDGNRAYRLPE